MNDVVGFCAACLTTLAFVPQAVKVYKTKQTNDLSLLLFVMFTAGVLLWLCYGILIDSYPIIISNIITLFLSGYILFEKIKAHIKQLH